MKRQELTNAAMCELVVLRKFAKNQEELIAELRRALEKSSREIKTLQAMTGDEQSKYLLNYIEHVLNLKVERSK